MYNYIYINTYIVNPLCWVLTHSIGYNHVYSWTINGYNSGCKLPEFVGIGLDMSRRLDSKYTRAARAEESVVRHVTYKLQHSLALLCRIAALGGSSHESWLWVSWPWLLNGIRGGNVHLELGWTNPLTKWDEPPSMHIRRIKVTCAYIWANRYRQKNGYRYRHRSRYRHRYPCGWTQNYVHRKLIIVTAITIIKKIILVVKVIPVMIIVKVIIYMYIYMYKQI